MKYIFLSLCALACVLCGAPSAAAQDHGAVGVTMGYPSSVGLMWHVAERLALRPEMSFSTSDHESLTSLSVSFPGSSISSSSTSTSTSSAVGVGMSGLFYVGRWDAVRAYVAPRFVYTRNSGTSTTTETSGVSTTTFSPLVPAGPTTPYAPVRAVATTRTNTSTFSSKSVAGLFGAAYTPHRRFSVFGEVGLGYTTSGSGPESTSDDEITISTSGLGLHGWSTRSGAGVIFYF